jgi:hypothetical protein
VFSSSLEFRVCILAIYLLSYTLVLSSTLIDASCQDHHLFILLICACIRPSTLVSGPFFLRRTILSLFTFSNMSFFPQHHLCVLSPPSCLFRSIIYSKPLYRLNLDHSLSSHYTMCLHPNHHLLAHSALWFYQDRLTSTSFFSVSIRTILSTLCLYQDHQLFCFRVMF